MHGTFASKFLYLLILGGIVGILLLASVGRLLALHRLRTAVEVTGRIVGKRIDRDDGTYYCVTYAFEDGAGASRQKEIQLRKASFDSLVSGERIRVRYESTNPENSYLADSLFMRSHTAAMLGWIIVAFVLACVVFGFVHECVILDRCPASD